jgi:hypothetical protein
VPRNIPDRPLPGWITADVIALTRATWEPLYGRRLTDDEIVEILLSVGNLFRLLRDSSPSQTKAASGSPAATPHRARTAPVGAMHQRGE